jgi:hypothetical protein
MDLYMNESMHNIHGFGQLCLILLISYTKVTYDNYNTTGINETFINIFFQHLQILYNYYIGSSCKFYPTTKYYYYYYYPNLA